MPLPEEDTVGALEAARQKLYSVDAKPSVEPRLTKEAVASLPHMWKEKIFPRNLSGGKRHVRLASVFFFTALTFFTASLLGAAIIFFMGSNSISVDKIEVAIEGPSTIAGGDTVPLTVTITNRNTVAVNKATVDVGFPAGTRDPENMQNPYPRYFEELGTIGSGETITRTVSAVVFGEANKSLVLPVAVSYSASGSNAVFVKRANYSLLISTTPLAITAEAKTETVSGQSFPITLTVTSNTNVPLQHVLVTARLPFGYEVTSTSVPLNNSSFSLGTLNPGESKKIVIKGTLAGSTNDERAFQFMVGTGASRDDDVLAISYMTLDVPVTLAAPFIVTNLAINGDTSANVILAPDTPQNVSLTYTNTLPTSITNATVSVKLSGSGVDYNSIRSTNGFYRSSDRTILFSRDTDPSLAQLAPGASGVGSFSFDTAALGQSASGLITFTTSVSGTRVGQTNVPEEVTASSVKTAKVATNVALTATSLHSTGTIISTGPVTPTVGETTTYAVVWSVKNGGNSIAGGTVTATLPSYVSYTGVTNGSGTFTYDPAARVVTWNVGDMAQGSTANGAFQIAFTPSTSQKGTAVLLTGRTSFSGFDRFAGIQITASADAVSTQTTGDAGYTPDTSIVR